MGVYMMSLNTFAITIRSIKTYIHRHKKETSVSDSFACIVNYTTMKSSILLLCALLSFAGSIYAFSTMGVPTRRSTMTMKRGGGGRGMKKNMLVDKPASGIGSASASGSSDTAGLSSTKWIQTPLSKNELSKVQDRKVSLLDTNVPKLKDGLTNPTGAVSVAKSNGETFCFSSSCPSCKIPLTKAKILGPSSSRPSSSAVACDFCKSAYDLKSGKKIEVSPEEAGGGLFAGIAQNLFKAQGNNDPLKLYQLGEKDGKLLISLE